MTYEYDADKTSTFIVLQQFIQVESGKNTVELEKKL